MALEPARVLCYKIDMKTAIMHHRARRLLAFLAVGVLACTAPPPITIRNLSYDDRFGRSTTMDVYLPPTEGVGRPGVLFVHGGAWEGGSRAEMEGAAIRLAQAGYVTASIDYRLSQEAIFPAAVQDCLCALAFFRAQADEFGLDPERVAVLGFSAGGHLVSMMGVASQHPALQPDCEAGTTAPPQAVIPAAGVHDLRAMEDLPAVRRFLGGTLEEIPAQYDLASPLTHVAAGAPPFLLIHGTVDDIVLEEQSVQMRDALAASGNDVRLLSIPGAGHAIAPSPSLGAREFVVIAQNPEAWIAIIDFLHETIGAP